jgi:histidyl-tRNA synthetase
MDKKLYDGVFKMVEEAGASEECLSVLRELVELKGDKVFEIVEKIRDCVKDYDKAAQAVDNLQEILKLVSESGYEIDMIVDAGFARGLEYYTGMIFEVYIPELDVALGGGGRYDRLIGLFGGEPTPAVGVAHGIDRMMLAAQEQKASLEMEEEQSVVVISINEQLKGEAFRIARIFRDAEIFVEVEVMGRKMAKALEDADRRNIDYAVIVGERELKEGKVVFRDLKKREQSTVDIEKLVETVKGRSKT